MDRAAGLQRLLRLTGLGMVVAVGVVMLLEILPLGVRSHLSCLSSWVATFGWCSLLFWFSGSRWSVKLSRPLWVVLLAAQGLTVALMIHYWRAGVGGLLLVLTAWQAAQVLSLRDALAWCLAQSLLVGLLHGQSEGLTASTVSYVATYGGLGFFAALAAHLARSEAESRRDLSRTVVELRTAQGLLAQASRHAERVHLARELHDGMGHRLTALSLNLETARQHLGGSLPEPAERAQGLARDLLRELRGVVTTLREDERPELDQALQALTSGIERPRTHLNTVGGLQIEDPVRAHALVRCVQELVTNALKHARAENLWVDVVATTEGVALKVRDDGCGGLGLREGHGLTGVRERLAELGGWLALTPGSGGFQASVWLPYSDAAS